jgi:hypothetical protein
MDVYVALEYNPPVNLTLWRTSCMQTIKLILISACSFFLSNTVLAATSPIACPTNITCNYETGSCDTADIWMTNGFNAAEPFEGSKTINLSAISAFKITDSYALVCVYAYSPESEIDISTLGSELVGANWVYGFGKKQANCSTVADPSQCATQN